MHLCHLAVALFLACVGHYQLDFGLVRLVERGLIQDGQAQLLSVAIRPRHLDIGIDLPHGGYVIRYKSPQLMLDLNGLRLVPPNIFE